jgi:nitrogen fixation protein NifU and related proteins
MSIDRSTPPLQSLYQQVILEHYRKPRNRGEMEDADAEVNLNNPTCGDEITLQLRLREGVVSDVKFRGQGCSISQASASMMTQQVIGKPLVEARAIAARFTEMMPIRPAGWRRKATAEAFASADHQAATRRFGTSLPQPLRSGIRVLVS